MINQNTIQFQWLVGLKSIKLILILQFVTMHGQAQNRNESFLKRFEMVKKLDDKVQFYVKIINSNSAEKYLMISEDQDSFELRKIRAAFDKYALTIEEVVKKDYHKMEKGKDTLVDYDFIVKIFAAATNKCVYKSIDTSAVIRTTWIYKNGDFKLYKVNQFWHLYSVIVNPVYKSYQTNDYFFMNSSFGGIPVNSEVDPGLKQKDALTQKLNYAENINSMVGFEIGTFYAFNKSGNTKLKDKLFLGMSLNMGFQKSSFTISNYSSDVKEKASANSNAFIHKETIVKNLVETLKINKFAPSIFLRYNHKFYSFSNSCNDLTLSDRPSFLSVYAQLGANLSFVNYRYNYSFASLDYHAYYEKAPTQRLYEYEGSKKNSYYTNFFAEPKKDRNSPTYNKTQPYFGITPAVGVTVTPFLKYLPRFSVFSEFQMNILFGAFSYTATADNKFILRDITKGTSFKTVLENTSLKSISPSFKIGIIYALKPTK